MAGSVEDRRGEKEHRESEEAWTSRAFETAVGPGCMDLGQALSDERSLAKQRTKDLCFNLQARRARWCFSRPVNDALCGREPPAYRVWAGIRLPAAALHALR